MSRRPPPGECWFHDPEIGWQVARDFVAWRVAETPDQTPEILDEIEKLVEDQGLIAIGYVSYEAGPGFDAAQKTHSPSCPVAEFAIFRSLEISGFADAPGEAMDWATKTTEHDYVQQIERLKDAISAGEIYQANHTFALESQGGDPTKLLQNMIRAQAATYGAYLDFGDRVIASASPELYFRRNGDQVMSEPMKGTRPRGRWGTEDQELRAELESSDKERAENLMITDMVRNDLGRLAEPGSVTVESLFEVRPYPAMWQMVSRVSAQTSARLSEIFAATFPAASITGAPKIKAMELIAREETRPRGPYCGAIGVVKPGRNALFNVAIRTAVYERATKRTIYGVGSGIVADSTPASEWAECWVKARIVTEAWPQFSLLETMKWCPLEGVPLLRHHLARAAFSADVFGYPMPSERAIIETIGAKTLGRNEPARLRLTIERSGNFDIECMPFEPWPSSVELVLAHERVDPADRMLYHKTTHRAIYERAMQSCHSTKDVLLVNIHGNITETTRANVAVLLDEKWVTPPIKDGLLPGVFRQVLLDQGKLEERSIHTDALGRVDGIVVFNALRGFAPATVLGIGPAISSETILSRIPAHGT
jgi:para-aminobenzoate synthetase/4-amino-4-deoxychorismate lyase